MTEGYIRGLSQFYADGLERMEIWIDKKHASLLPHRDNQRISIILMIGEKSYNAGIRSTPTNEYVWICPDLKDDFGGKMGSLARALTNSGFQKNQRVSLDIEGNTIKIALAPRGSLLIWKAEP
jgi:hypothetical protein